MVRLGKPRESFLSDRSLATFKPPRGSTATSRGAHNGSEPLTSRREAMRR